MSRRFRDWSATRIKAYATNADLLDVDAIKTAIATATSQQTYTTFNGALSSGGAVALDPPRGVSVTTSESVGSYVAAGIVFTGTYNGAVQTETLTLTATGGNETIRGSKPFDTVTSIVVPAMSNTSGQFRFGVADLFAPPGEWFRAVRSCDADGNIAVEVTKKSGVETVIIPVAKHVREDILFQRLVGGSTSTGIVVYW